MMLLSCTQWVYSSRVHAFIVFIYSSLFSQAFFELICSQLETDQSLDLAHLHLLSDHFQTDSLSLCLPALSVRLSDCLSPFLSLCLSALLPSCLTVSLSPFQTVSLSVSFFSPLPPPLFACQAIYSSARLSLCLPVCLHLSASLFKSFFPPCSCLLDTVWLIY